MNENQVEIEVDGAAVLVDGDSLFGNFSDELKRKLGPERVLTEIFVDNRAIDIDEEASLLELSVKDLGEIKLISKEVGALLKDSLQLAPSICDALLLDCDDIENLFAESSFIEANERIAELSSLVDWLLQMISSLQSYGSSSFQEIKVESGTAVDAVTRMDELLRSLHSKLQSQDYPGFRDILKTSFKSELESWKILFIKVAAEWAPKEKLGKA